MQVRAGLDVHGQAVGPGPDELGHVAVGILDDQVNVEEAPVAASARNRTSTTSNAGSMGSTESGRGQTGGVAHSDVDVFDPGQGTAPPYALADLAQ
jgi:hypothetical protein